MDFQSLWMRFNSIWMKINFGVVEIWFVINETRNKGFFFSFLLFFNFLVGVRST